MKDKVRENDLTLKELPHTRFEVFKDLIKTQKRALISLSLLAFVFLMPFAVDIILFGQFIVIAGNNTTATSQQIASTVYSLIFYMMIIGIPCNMVAFVGLGGLAEACKSLVWQEGLLVGPVFFKGIKKTFKTSLFFGFIMGISLFLLVVGIFFFLRTMAQGTQWLNGVGIGLCVVQFIVLSIISAYSLTLSVYYDLSLRATFKNGWIFFVLGFLKNLLLFLVTIAIPVGIMFLGMIGQIVSIVIIIIFSSLFMVCWTLVSHKLFDKYINQENYPNYVNRGLYKEVVTQEE